MKSIKKFRSTRHALKQGGSDPADPVPPAGEDEFPLGPRLFRKSRPTPGPKESDMLEAPDEEKADDETDSSEPNGLKIIPSAEWEMVVRGKGATETGPESESRVDNPPEGGEKGSRKSRKAASRERAGSTSEDIFESEPEEPKPVVVRPLEEPVPGAESPPEPAGPSKRPVQDGAGKSARPAKDTAPKTVAEKLKPYALSVGAHSYVLVDEEGRLIKASSDSRRKPR